ncbi:DUF3299 domain-containing protein [Candidatus Poribacteria bacterium]|nr:DUF3299 domain-containing protein [Candidatus Poribacteria bacterium]
MKMLKTKNRRSAWLNFAMVSAVVVGLSLGVFQFLPKSHPMRALRGGSDRTGQVLEPDSAQGVSLVTEAHQSLTFKMLTSYPFREPNWAKMEDPAYIASLKLDEQISPQIQAMNGRKVEIQGFMLPLHMSDGNLRTFMLLKDQMACCFGNMPRLNEWVYVRVPEKKKIDIHQDVLITLLGTLHVGAKFEGVVLTGIYHLDLDRIQIDQKE